jgi:hypothetical protein
MLSKISSLKIGIAIQIWRWTNDGRTMDNEEFIQLQEIGQQGQTIYPMMIVFWRVTTLATNKEQVWSLDRL